MRVLLAQLTPAPGDPSTNLATVAGLVDEDPEADLVVLPELFICGYDPAAAADLALAAEDPAFAPIIEAARTQRTAVIVGFAERIGRDVANAVACIDTDGTWAGCYRKTHLFGAEEEAFFVGGESLLVVDLAGVRVGVLICFDMEFPEPARALCQSGASLLVTVAANMEPFGPDHELAARARALDNRRPHIYVNRLGEQAGHRFVGGSLVASASGEVVSALGGTAGVRCMEVEPTGEVPFEVDYLSHLHADMPVHFHALGQNQGGRR
ncbi:MAG TPA: nitrilase-related carbon-nitrogen hydrolase [Solirubrobacteraceae bacterium]|nr:nitrilase-related carbon-nitrogen hydrolase [Solirubrobacteraceae bacterium]